jgi:hypothetical protein
VVCDGISSHTPGDPGIHSKRQASTPAQLLLLLLGIELLLELLLIDKLLLELLLELLDKLLIELLELLLLVVVQHVHLTSP